MTISVLLLLSQTAPAQADLLRRFAYVTTKYDSNLLMYEINPDTGVLTSLGSPVPAGGVPTAIAVHPHRRWLYVTNKVTDNVFRYDIDATTGRLSLPADYSVAARYGPNSIAVHPNGRWAYVTNKRSLSVSMYEINSDTGILTPRGMVSAQVGSYSIAMDSSGRFAYVANERSDTLSMYRIDDTTGQLIHQGNIETGHFPTSVVVSGRFVHVVNDGGGSPTGSVLTHEMDSPDY